MKISSLLSSMINFIILIIASFAMINIIHFSWIIAEPEGFWGFFYFLGITGVVMFTLVVAIVIIFFLFSGILFLVSDFPNNFSLKNIVKPLGYLILILVILFVNTLTGSGISMYINKKIADRYSYLNESEKLINEGKYNEALEYSKKAYEKFGNVSAPSHFFVLSWLFQKTDFGIEKILTKQYATTINYAYCLDQNRTDLDLAVKLYIKALNISDTSFLKEDEDYKIFPIHSLADLNLNKGNYAQAETYFNELLQFSNKSTNDDIEYVCISQETFANYYLQTGDFNKAKLLREKNVELWEEKDQSLKSLQYLTLLLSATSSEIITQNFNEAGKYLIKAKPLAEKRNEMVVYPVFLLMKGIYCNYVSLNGKGNEEIIEKGWLEKIESIFKKSKSISEKFKDEAETCFIEVLNNEKSANGNKSLGYAQGLHRLAIFYIEQGNKIKANELLMEAKQICEKYKTSNIHLYNTVLLASAISEYKLKGYDSIKNNLEELEQYYFNRLIANYAFLTEIEREKYKNLVDNNLAAINSIYIATNTPETRSKMYNNIIATKEIALYANENTRNFLRTLNDSMKNEYYGIIKQRDSIEIVKNKVANVKEEVNNSVLLKEKAIQTKISSMLGFKQFDPRAIKWNNISTNLKENEISIEFVHNNINHSEQYYALVIKKDFTAPELIPLFEEKVLKNLLNQPGNSEDRINAIYGKLKDSLYSLIWKPLEGNLTNIQKAYISVSGILYGVSFLAMLNDRDIDIILLGSTRQIAMKTEDKGQKYSSAVLVGGVNYGKSLNSNNKIGSNRSNFTNLPFTNREVQDIDIILSSNRPEIKVNLVKGDSASEVFFNNLVKRKPDILHLATHGYYYPSENINSSNLLIDPFSSSNLSPMLNSGIVLSGVNNASNLNSENDGFLSAQEIARMDLSNLDLTVLSACETGLGKIDGSEGVFGLQRAFKQAGAKSLLMSLWKVPDEETASLMNQFYDNYFHKRLSKSMALKMAQNEMKLKNKSPFTWGGFILLER